MLQTYKKIAFVREPMELIVSAYQNKFAQDYEGRTYHHKYDKSIIMKYRKHFTGEVTDEHYTKFDEFVQYLIDRPPNKNRNEHWERQYKLEKPPEGLVTKALMKTYFSMISEEKFLRLRHAYDEDYEIFGLHKPTYLEVIGSV